MLSCMFTSQPSTFWDSSPNITFFLTNDCSPLMTLQYGVHIHTLYIYTEWLIKFETSTITVAGPVAVSLSFACSAAASSTTWHGRSTPAAAGDHLLHGTWYLDPSIQYHGLPGLRNQGCSVHSRKASQCTPCHQDPKLYSPQPGNKTKQHSHL